MKHPKGKKMLYMNATKLINKALRENPDTLVILDIAARAHEMEDRELPREIGASTEVIAISADLQCAI